MNQVVDFINVHRDRYVDELKQYLAIPSISALPEHAADVRRAAQWTAEAIGAAGLEHVQVIDTPGHPVVYGDWLHAPGKPTILFYGHYDVQPVDPLHLWTTPPFEASVRDGEIYARGAADYKGQVFMHIKAVEAHLRNGGRLPVNIKFFIEGEEEVGSANLDDFVRAHKQDLAADVVVISDSPMFDRGIPSICYGLRGLCYFQVDVRGSSTDLHSGSFGGALANPAFVDEAVGPGAPTGTRKLYEDKEQGFVVLAHCNPKPHKSPPHDHGSSWAVYGQAVKYTDMSEFRRLDGGQGAGEANLEKVKSYRLEPGHAGVYDVGAIHAIDYPDGSRFVRVTGRDLDYVQRLKFDTAAGKAITIESATAGRA